MLSVISQQLSPPALAGERTRTKQRGPESAVPASLSVPVTVKFVTPINAFPTVPVDVSRVSFVSQSDMGQQSRSRLGNPCERKERCAR